MDFPFTIKKEEEVDYFLISHSEDEPTEATVCDKYSNELSEVSDNVIKQEPNEYSMNLVHESQSYLAHDESVDRERTVGNHISNETNLQQIGIEIGLGNSSHTETNVFDTFLAKSSPMGLRPVNLIKIQRIFSEDTVMQSPSASIDESTTSTLHASQLILDIQLLSEASECTSTAQNQKPYKCNVCEKSFTQSFNLTTHMRIHDGVKLRHIKIHNGEKPYKCSECDTSFTHSFNLNAHKRIHNGRPYNCSKCDKSFSNSSNLSRHIKIHNDEKSYKCSECNKSFHQSGDLSRHMKVHSGEKPYKCSECDTSFTHSCNLTTHMRTHNGERPYNCSKCDKSFSHSSHLTIHMRIHNGERPYKCLVCNKSFPHSSSLSYHMKIHTENNRKVA